MTWRARLAPYRPILDPLFLPLLELYYGDDSTMNETHAIGLFHVLASKPASGPFADALLKFVNSPMGQMLIQFALAYLAKQIPAAATAPE